jgi:hypothetical protein
MLKIGSYTATSVCSDCKNFFIWKNNVYIKMTTDTIYSFRSSTVWGVISLHTLFQTLPWKVTAGAEIGQHGGLANIIQIKCPENQFKTMQSPKYFWLKASGPTCLSPTWLDHHNAVECLVKIVLHLNHTTKKIKFFPHKYMLWHLNHLDK